MISSVEHRVLHMTHFFNFLYNELFLNENTPDCRTFVGLFSEVYTYSHTCK